MRIGVEAAAVMAAVLLFLSAPAAVSRAEPPRAVLPVTSHDFGTLEEGEQVSHAFTVRNDGTVPLRIERVDLPWPGMTARFKRIVPPGQEATVTVGWDTTGRKGRFDGEAVVTLDDPAQPRVTVVLKALVRPLIEIRPYAAVFLSVFKGEALERTVTVVNNGDRPLRITRLEPEGSHFAAAIEALEPGRIYQLRVTVPPGVAPGRYREAVSLHTDHPVLSRLEVAVNVLVKADVYVNPPDVDFGTVSLPRVTYAPHVVDFLTQTFIVRKRAGEFEINSIVSDVPSLEISQEPRGSSAAFRIDVGLARDRVQRGPLTGSIRIITSDPDFPALVVPVRGEVK